MTTNDEIDAHTLLELSTRLASRGHRSKSMAAINIATDLLIPANDPIRHNRVQLSVAPNIIMQVRPGDCISDELLCNNQWEPELSSVIVDIAKTGGILVDVGANMGYFSLIWAGLNENNISYAVEPVFDNITLLRNNIELNNLQSQISILPVAMSNHRGLSLFEYGPSKETGHGGIVYQPQSNTTGHVVTAMLDDYFDHIDLLKIDVEGADTLVILGATNLLRNKKIQTIVFEVNRPRCKLLNISENLAIEFLQSNGYEVEVITAWGDNLVEYIARPKQ